MSRCPNCNSAAANVLSSQIVFGREALKLQCSHCGRRWRRFRVVQRYSFPTCCPCPKCAERGHVSATQGEIRYMACQRCGERWKVFGTQV